MEKPADNTALLVEVARLYYDHDFSQQQIAEKVGLSRPVVSRLLTQARDQGIVRIEILDPAQGGIELETSLQDRYRLKKVIVVPSDGSEPNIVKERLGRAAAKYLDEIVEDGLTLGISWGTTVREIARHVVPRPVRDMTVVQIVGGISRSDRDTHASESALKIGEKYQAVPYLLPVPAIVDNPALKRSITSDKNISRVLELGRQADIALFSVGVFSHQAIMVQAEYFEAADVDMLLSKGVVGDVCSRLINASGEICSRELDERTIGLELQELRKKSLAIAVAGGEEKIDTVRAALKGAYFNVLITDESVANALLAA